jgi:hypothetical protein
MDQCWQLSCKDGDLLGHCRRKGRGDGIELGPQEGLE